MVYKDRYGNLVVQKSKQDKLWKNMYHNMFGRAVIKVLVSPKISRAAGRYLESRPSKLLIKSFVKKNKIDLNDYVPCKYTSYNEFFTREIQPSLRLIDMTPNHLITPCDGKITAYKIDSHTSVDIKNSIYSLTSLLASEDLAAKYSGGWCLIIRLTIDNYHRYCYIDDGQKEDNVFIKGKLHTVHPIACAKANVYKENCREYCIIHTDNFGDVIHMEVGALMVGRIVNYHNAAQVKRGTPKGKFELGGSTVVLLFQQDTVMPSEDIIKNTHDGYETIVKMGEKIGEKYSSPDE